MAATKIGDVLIRRSNLQDAIQYYNKALDIYSRMNAYERYARTTAAIGMIFNQGGRYDLADKSLKDAIDQFHNLGMPTHEADIMLKYAEAMFSRDDFAASLNNAKNALAIYSELKNEQGQARAKIAAAKAQIQINPSPEVLQWLDEAFQIYLSQNNTPGKANAQYQIGEYYMANNNTNAAIRAYTSAAEMAEKSNEYNVLLNTHMRFGMMNFQTNKLQESLKHYKGALALAQNAGNRKITKHIQDQIDVLNSKIK